MGAVIFDSVIMFLMKSILMEDGIPVIQKGGRDIGNSQFNAQWILWRIEQEGKRRGWASKRLSTRFTGIMGFGKLHCWNDLEAIWESR